MKPLLLFASFALFCGQFLSAAPTDRLIPFQGRLTKQDGTVYSTGQFTVTFKLYEDTVGGSELWTERHEKVGIINGMINVFLGSITKFDDPNGDENTADAVTFDETRYLGITIDADNNAVTADPEMIPRQMIIPAFWAKTADNADKLDGFDWSDLLVGQSNNPSSSTIRGDKLENDGITANQIATGAVTGDEILDGTITSADIATDSITGNNIQDGSISSADLGFEYAMFGDKGPVPSPTGWNNVTLDTIQASSGTSITLNTTSGVFTLAPGTYFLDGHNTTYSAGSSQGIIAKASDDTEVIKGTGHYSDAGSSSTGTIRGYLTVTETTQYRMRVHIELGSGASWRLGVIAGEDDDEDVFSTLRIIRIK